MEETSLMRQLRKLSVPQTTLLLQDKVRPSLLFDHRVASSLGCDAFFAYGTNGLEKLQIMNPLFKKFEWDLFSANFKTFERSVQTQAENDKLDQKIEHFLTMVSPYLLFRAAQEALEWLIYRYHIHMFNIDALIAAVLPHYHTQTFVRVLQLLDLRDKRSHWSWLMNVKTSGEPLTSSALFNRFNNDESFRKFICDLAPNILKVYKADVSVTKPIVSFSMLTVYFSLERMNTVTDNLISCLLPYVIRALNSELSNYKACAYLVISKIVTKVKLSDAIVNEIMAKLFRNTSCDLQKETFELGLLIFQQQDRAFTCRKAISLLWSLKHAVKFIHYLVNNYQCSRLLNILMKQSIISFFVKKRNGKLKICDKIMKFIQNVLITIVLDKKTVTMCFKTILKQYSKSLKSVRNKENLSLLKKCGALLLRNLEIKWPHHFDQAVHSFFKKKLNRKQSLMEFVNDSVCNVKHVLFKSSKTMLLMGGDHVNPDIRKNAVKLLLKKIKKRTFHDREFIESTLMQRLKDDDPDVVAAVLSAPKTLVQFLSRENLHSGLVAILMKKIKEDSPWYSLQLKSLRVLHKLSIIQRPYEQQMFLEEFIILLPFIFPLHSRSLEGFQLILDSFGTTESPIINTLQKDTESLVKNAKQHSTKLIDLNYAVISSVQSYVKCLKKNLKSLYFKILTEKINEDDRTVSLCAIYLLILEENFDFCTQNAKLWKDTLHLFENLLAQNFIEIDTFSEHMTQKDIILKFVNINLERNKLPVSMLFFSLSRIIQKLCLDKNIFKKVLQSNDIFHVSTELFEFLIIQFNAQKRTMSENFKQIIGIFLNYQFSNLQELFWFMSHLWSNAIGNASVMIQVAAMNITYEFCSKKALFACIPKSEFQLFPTLFTAIASPQIEVRSCAMRLLSKVVTHCEECDYMFKELCTELNNHTEEITTDFRQFGTVLRKWLMPVFSSKLFDNIILSPKDVMDVSSKIEVLKYFLNLILDVSTPCPIVTLVLLLLKDADSPIVLSAFIPILKHYLAQYKSEEHVSNKLLLNIIESLMNKFTAHSVSCINDVDSEEAKILLECLQFTETKLSPQEISIQTMTLNLMTKELFSGIPSTALQHKILNILVDLFISTGSSDINAKVGKTLRKLCTSASLILKVFQEPVVPKMKKTTLREVKRIRSPDKFDKSLWQRITVILEIIQNKTKIEGRKLLIPELFSLLSKTLDFESESSVEYLRQLILSSIYNCCQELGIGGLDERQFQVELIVQCIRSSTNPKTHHQSLLLLNLAATMFPEYVLSNVMSIFTFMGSSLIRQDDSYSFQVISQTIETIVPAFLEASTHQKESDANQVVASVIRVFVDSLVDIPRHRQLPLFTKLVSTLDPSKYLWIPLSQICDQYTTMFHNLSSGKHKNWEVSPILEFAINLHKQFSPEVQIETCKNLLNFLTLLPDSKQNADSNAELSKIKEPFDLANRTNEQLKIFKHNVLSYINIWLSSPTFFNQISDLDAKAQCNLEEKYELLLEVILSYLQHQLKIVPSNMLLNAKNESTIITLLYKLINHVNALLPCKLFIRIIKRLLHNPITVVQQKAIELLNSKLEMQQQIFSENDESSLLKLLKPLLKIVKSSFDKTLNSNTRNVLANQQIALLSLHLLTKALGLKYPEKFSKVLTLTIQILSSETIQSELVVNTLLCLAQLCKCLNIHVLPFLNHFMPNIIKLIKKDSNSNEHEYIVLAVLVALESLINNLGAFMSSYMEDILTNFCILSVKYHDGKGTTIKERLGALKSNLANDIAERVLIPAIESSYEKILHINKIAVCPLMDILSEKLTNIDFTAIKPFSSSLQKLYLKLLGFRFSHSSPDTYEQVYVIEKHIIASLITFVLKLSETGFTQFFQTIYLWATSTEDNHHKTFTFYRLTFELSTSLKNIFTLFAKYFIKNAALVLDSSNTSKSNLTFNNLPDVLTSQLLNFLLDTLSYCFQYDDGHLLDKDSFNVLMQPLVDQIENQQGSIKDFKDRIENHLSVCIGNFMAAVSDHSQWKALNYQIMLKTRHSMAEVRFGSLQIIREMVNKMGDRYLAILPESIPFLAEMMEDESAEVEEECRSIISDMEKILGEPLKKYF